MPSFSLYGRKWHVGADDGPVFAAFGVLFHAFWLVNVPVLPDGVAAYVVLMLSMSKYFPEDLKVDGYVQVLIAYTATDLLAMPHVCTSQARQDIMAVAGLMICFVIGFILEVSLIYEGCRGTTWPMISVHCCHAQGAST